MNLSAMLNYFTSNAWAMRLSTLQSMRDIAIRHMDGIKLGSDEIAAIVSARDEKAAGKSRPYGYDRTTGKAVISLTGVIAKHASMVNGESQPRGTSIETLRQQFEEAMADPNVSSIVLHIESPGGYIGGLAEFADRVFAASHEKPIVAYADDLCCSAAYWIGSQANRLYCSRAAEVGSIGVYSIWLDSSKKAENEGLKFHIIRSGDHKGVGAPGIEITDPQLEQLTRENDAFYEIFIATVLRGRSSKLNDKSLRKLADGSVQVGLAAVKSGLVDGVATIEQVLAAEPPQLRQGLERQASWNEEDEEDDDNEAAAGAADNRTHTKGIDMAEKTAITPAGGEVDIQAAMEQARKEAATQERKRVQAINETLAGDALADVRGKAIDEELTIDAAKSLAFDELRKSSAAREKELTDKLADRDARLAAVANAGESLVAPDNSGSATGGDEAAARYIASVNELKATCGEGSAYIEAAKRDPSGREAWMQQQARR